MDAGTEPVLVSIGPAETTLLGALGTEYADVETASVAVLVDTYGGLMPLDGGALEPGYPDVGTASVAVLVGTDGRAALFVGAMLEPE